MSLSLIIVASVLLTSILSGVIGMAGGIVLMAVLVSLKSVAAAMIIHGAVQATANGSRAWFLRKHIVWHILPGYLIGAALAMGLFVGLTLVPDPAVILVIIGVFPWLARVVRGLRGLDVTRRGIATVCGMLVTAAQLLAGASGPVLDVFYLNTQLNRHQIIASKAVTQTLGHLLKLIYYGLIIGLTEPISPLLLLLAMSAAVLGTRLGTLLLGRFDDAQFRRISGWVILAIGALCVIRGASTLLGGH